MRVGEVVFQTLVRVWLWTLRFDDRVRSCLSKKGNLWLNDLRVNVNFLDDQVGKLDVQK